MRYPAAFAPGESTRKKKAQMTWPGLDGSRQGQDGMAESRFAAKREKRKRQTEGSPILSAKTAETDGALKFVPAECWRPGELQPANFLIALDQVSFGPGLGAT
jgi:hypothetical protein